MTLQEKVLNWMFNGDVGTSSQTMAAIACGLTKMKYGFSRPYDSGDFNRCYKLVLLVPEIKEHFPKIKELHPEFGPILDNWDRLVMLLEEDKKESPNKATRLWLAMKELDTECYLVGGWYKVPNGWTKDPNDPDRID